MNQIDPSRPAIYRLSRGWFWIFLTGGAAMVGGGLVMGAAALFGNEDTSDSVGVRLLLFTIALSMTAAGVSSLLAAFRFRVVLTTDRLRVRVFFGHRETSREEVSGFRFRNGALVLERTAPSASSVKVPLNFKADDQFWAWLDDLENFDLSDDIASENEILSNEAFGATDERRAQRLEEARQTSRRFHIFVLAVTLWAFLYPYPLEILALVLILTPWVAIELIRRYNGLIRIDGKPNDVYPEVAAALMLPGFLLLMLIPDIWRIPDLPRALGAGVVVAAVMLGMILRLTSKRERSHCSVSAALLFLVLIPYGYGVVVSVEFLW